MTSSIRKARLMYCLSWALVLLLCFVAVFGSYLMPSPITEEHKIALQKQVIDGAVKMVAPPFAPSSDHWLGTDHRGYDILSLLLNGAKYTLGFALAATLVRFLLAIPLGLFAGAKDKGRNWLSTMQLITSAVPPLLFLFPTMYGLKQVLPQEEQDLVLFALITVLGVFQLMNQFADRAHFYSGKLFIAASKTLGASTSRIIFRHLLPHLRPELLFALLTDFVQVLFLLGQLAVVSIFLGGGEWYVIDDGPPRVIITLTMNGEWGGMIMYGIKTLRSYPWILITSGLFLTVSILILTFFSRQMQKRLSQPHIYQTKPLLQNKPLLGTWALVSTVCIALLLFGTNKAPVHNQPEPSVATTNAPAQMAMAPKDKPTFDEALVRKNMYDSAKQFFSYLHDNRWDYANLLLYANTIGPITSETEQPSAPFDKWLTAFASKKYQFLEVGTLTPEGETYKAELKIQGPNGPESWYMIIGVTSKSSVRLLNGVGGPAS
jgi:ABC-type dipeptide/oligopeptide/nickel transport system permease subunit